MTTSGRMDLPEEMMMKKAAFAWSETATMMTEEMMTTATLAPPETTTMTKTMYKNKTQMYQNRICDLNLSFSSMYFLSSTAARSTSILSLSHRHV